MYDEIDLKELLRQTEFFYSSRDNYDESFNISKEEQYTFELKES